MKIVQKNSLFYQSSSGHFPKRPRYPIFSLLLTPEFLGFGGGFLNKLCFLRCPVWHYIVQVFWNQSRKNYSIFYLPLHHLFNGLWNISGEGWKNWVWSWSYSLPIHHLEPTFLVRTNLSKIIGNILEFHLFISILSFDIVIEILLGANGGVK